MINSTLCCCVSYANYRGYICTAQKIANIQEELDDLVRSALPAASLRGDAVGYKRCMKLKEAYRHTRRTMDGGECAADVTLTISSSNGSSNGSNSNCQQVQCSAPEFTVPAAAAAAVAAVTEAVTAAVVPGLCAGA
jgi:hypothetical protein